MSTDVFLISGIPGAGKTTVSRLLAERFDLSVHVEGDLIGHHFIVRGLVSPEAEPQDEATRQLELRRKNVRMLAANFLKYGMTVVIDDVVISPGVFEGYHSWRPELRFVQLSPRLDVVEHRDTHRDKQVFEIWSHLDAQMRAWPEPRPGLWLDSSDMTAEETVDAILR